jgi:hypothetical protein
MMSMCQLKIQFLFSNLGVQWLSLQYRDSFMIFDDFGLSYLLFESEPSKSL